MTDTPTPRTDALKLGEEGVAGLIADYDKLCRQLEAALKFLSDCEICGKDLITPLPDGSAHHCVCLSCWNSPVAAKLDADAELADARHQQHLLTVFAEQQAAEYQAALADNDAEIARLQGRCELLSIVIDGYIQKTAIDAAMKDGK